MDATLMQLQAGLRANNPAEWLRHRLPVIAPVHGHCACGLNPIQLYYATGEEAIRAALINWRQERVAEITQLFHSFLALEISALRRECDHPDWSGCGLRQTDPSKPRELS